MNRICPHFAALSAAILLCSSMPALSATDTDSATTDGDHPAGKFSYAESTPNESSEFSDNTLKDRSQTNQNSGDGTVSIISTPDPTLPDVNSDSQSDDSDKQLRNRPIPAGQNANSSFGIRSSEPRDTTADDSLESSLPRDANPDVSLESSMPADANPGAELESSMPADADPGDDLESSMPADANPGAGLESSMPANATPDAGVESAQPFSRNTAPLNR